MLKRKVSGQWKRNIFLAAGFYGAEVGGNIEYSAAAADSHTTRVISPLIARQDSPAMTPEFKAYRAPHFSNFLKHNFPQKKVDGFHLLGVYNQPLKLEYGDRESLSVGLIFSNAYSGDIPIIGNGDCR